jgi:enoyl-CoA hydratase/carnithine racemase
MSDDATAAASVDSAARNPADALVGPAAVYASLQALSVRVDDGVAWVTIDNGPVNLFDRVLYPEMARVVAALATDDGVRVVVLRSANPDFFIAHFDVGLILSIPGDAPSPQAPTAFQVMCETLRTMPKATIAMIEGRVGGGGSELTLSCDMRFAARGRAVFNQPEVALGILPGGTGTVRLPRLVGRSRALEVILGCDDIDADSAAAWGWVNRALAADEIGPFVERLARRIALFPPHAVASAKASVLEADGDLTDTLTHETQRFMATLSHDRTQRAMTRFMERGGQTPEGEGRLGELCAEL